MSRTPGLPTPPELDDRGLRLLEELRTDPLHSEVRPRRLRRMVTVAMRRLGSVTVVVESLWDPHNLAAVARTVEGLGLAELHVVEEPHRYRRARGVARGADRWIEVRRHSTIAECVARLREAGRAIYAADPAGDACAVDELPVDEPLALIFGTEGSGLSRAAAGAADGRFRVPMSGFTESFNVSVSAAIALFSVTRRRRARLGVEGDLADREVQELVRGWLGAVRRQRTRGRP